MGRPRVYENAAERQRAYRERRAEEVDALLRGHHQRQERLRAALADLEEAVVTAARADPASEWARLYEQHPELDIPDLLHYLAQEIRGRLARK